MRIAIIASGFFPVVDGVTVSGFQRLQKLSKWGHEVLLFCPDYRELESIYPNWRDYTGNILPGVRVVNLPSTPFMGVDFERNVSYQGYKIVLQELAEFQPDLIHVDEPERLFIGFFRRSGIDFAKREGIPCVSFFRTNFIEYIEDFFPLPFFGTFLIEFLVKQLVIWVYNSYDATLISSRTTQKKLTRLGIKNIMQEYQDLCGFDVEKFDSSLRENNFFEKNYGIPTADKKIKLVFLGRLTPDKGWGFTLDSIPYLADFVNPNNLAFIIIGDGEMAEEIATKLSQLTPEVHLLGRVGPDEVPKILINSDIHVTTSEKETRGLTVLEAFAAEIPVIAPRAGGVAETIQDGWNGFLFEPKNREDFLTKLQQLINNPELRKVMGKRGRERVENSSWDHAVQNLVGIWEKQINQKKAFPSPDFYKENKQP